MQNKIILEFHDHPPTQRRFIEVEDKNWEFIKDVIKRGAKTHGLFSVEFKEIK